MPPRKKSAGKKSGSAKGTRKASAKKSSATKVTAEIGDGTLEGQRLQQEFLKKANEWIFKNTSRALDLFRSFDENGDGVLSHDEFRKGMARLKAPFTEAEVEAVIKLIDIDGSGDLDFDEFKNGIRYRHPKPTAAKGDGLPPLTLLRDPMQLCPHCGLGLWNPYTPSHPRYLHVNLKLMEFRERPDHPCHLVLSACSSTTIYALARRVHEEHGGTTSSLSIYRYISPEDRDKDWDDSEPLDEALTLEDCGYEGGSRIRPKSITLCYDFLPVLCRCPLLNAGQVGSSGTRSSQARKWGTGLL
eukprot:scpid48079/ scgid26388/ Calmodulin-like protein